MSIPNPNPNIADGIKSDNKTYSSNKIESLISAATELPIPEAGDAGKVLTVNAGADGFKLDTPVDPASVLNTGYTEDASSESITVPASTITTATDITVTETGIYLLTVFAKFKGTTSGKQVSVLVRDHSDSSTLIATNECSLDGEWPNVVLTSLVSLTAEQVVDIDMYHTYTANTDVDYQVKYIKLV